jgi:hypothetical protein
MGIESNLNHTMLDICRDYLPRHIDYLQPHWEIGGVELWVPWETLNERETSNPMNPRRIVRWGEPSLKIWRIRDGEKVEIASMAWEGVRALSVVSVSWMSSFTRPPSPMVDMGWIYRPMYPDKCPEYLAPPQSYQNLQWRIGLNFDREIQWCERLTSLRLPNNQQWKQ